jgi:ATP-binding cassette subfamily B protein
MEAMVELGRQQADIADAPDARDLPAGTGRGGDLVFEDVSYRHGGRTEGLRRISFEAPPGTTTALVGASGAGKSTIARLALRLIDPQEGQVLLDGLDLRRVRHASLRRAVALVPQDVALFNDTLYTNIAFADPEATPEQVRAGRRRRRAGRLHRGAAGRVRDQGGRAGLKLSGGERQRVGIARALLADPRC